MLNYKILLASFALVFLAELGDKTQLTALAFSASSRSPVSVFLGTSLALICTTALAVFLGEFLSRHLPENLIIIASAVGFILVGVILLVNIARKVPESPHAAGRSHPPQTSAQAPTPTPAAAPSLLARTILRHAAAFENEAATTLRQAARQMPPGPQRQELERLAAEEENHRRRLDTLPGTPSAGENAGIFRDPTAGLEIVPPRIEPADPRPGNDEPRGSAPPEACPENTTAALLDRLIRAEEGAAAFYLSLARLARIPAVRAAFRQLAAEEIDHVGRLHRLLDPGENARPPSA